MEAEHSSVTGTTIHLEPESDTSLQRLANIVLAARWPIVFSALVAAILVAAIVLFLPRTYTAETTFMPQSPHTLNLPSGASGLAATLGLNLPSGDPGQSPGLYVELLTSRQVLAAAVDTTYPALLPGSGAPASVADWFGASGRSPSLRREDAIERLKRHLSATADARLGVVRLSVQSKSPALSLELVQFLVSEVNRFNLENRQSQAVMERRFVDGRLQSVQGQLRQAEDDLQSFLQRNRDFKNSPVLTFEQDRLSQNVQLYRQLSTSLAQSYEQARIEEVRDTPLITVIEPPAAPVLPDRRGLLAKLAAALVLGAAVAAATAFLRAALMAPNPGSPDDDDFRRLRAEAWEDVKHPLRGMLRVIRR